MRTVSFEPDSLILSDEGVLYVLNRRGISGVRAKNIHQLHEALKPYIDARPDERALLDSVSSAQRPKIEKYLSKLHEAGAIRLEDKDEADCGEHHLSLYGATAAMGAGCARASLMIGSRRVFVSLDGVLHSATQDHDACIFFAAPDQVGREMLSFGKLSTRGTAITYVVAPSSEAARNDLCASELDRRGTYARWLLLNIENLPEPLYYVNAYEQGELSRHEDLAGRISEDLRDLKPLFTISNFHQHAHVIRAFLLDRIADAGGRSPYLELLFEFLRNTSAIVERYHPSVYLAPEAREASSTWL